MPRNAAGIYSLPGPVNPVVSGTTITSTWANTTLTDLATAMTGSLARNGDGAMTAPLELVDGNVAAPALVPESEPTTGLYRPGAGQLGVSILGVLRAAVDATGVRLNATEYASWQPGFRNKVINGRMEIAQRGTSFAGLGAGGVYTLDRFRYQAVGAGVVTVSQSSDVPPGNEFQNSLRVTVTTADAAIAATDVYALEHLIEGYNVRDLIGRSIAVSFWVRAPVALTNYGVAFRNSGDDRSYVTTFFVNLADTWEKKTVLLPVGLITAGTWNWTNGTGLKVSFGLAVGLNFTVAAGSWQVGNFLGDGANANALANVGFIFAITGLQLEYGAAATPFEHRQFAAELALCQRYYEKSYDLTVNPGTATAVGQEFFHVSGASNSNGGTKVRYTVRKRAIPTSAVVYSPVTGTTNRVRDLTGVADVIPTLDAIGETGFRVFTTGLPGASLNLTWHWVADAEL